MNIRVLLSIFLSLFLASCSGSAEPVADDIVVEQPMLRATVPGAPVGAGYLVIRNTGKGSDRLVSASSEFSEKAEVHNMEMVDGVMKMRPVDGGLEIGPGQTVVLAKGGLHLMFMKLGSQLNEGDTHNVILKFEKTGDRVAEFSVGPIAGH